MKNQTLSDERKRELREAVRARYRDVAIQPQGHFPYPVGRDSVVALGYKSEWLAAIPPGIIDRFVGIGNPYSVAKPDPGHHVLDVGCGCGLDTFVAAHLVGPDAPAVGVDLTPEMLTSARQAAAESRVANVRFEEASVEALPFRDQSFDFVISNGVLNLVPDKDAAFREIRRVLRPGGTFLAADLVVVETIPPEILADKDAWST